MMKKKTNKTILVMVGVLLMALIVPARKVGATSTMTAPQVDDPDTTPFLLTRMNTKDNTVSIVLRDATIEHVSVVIQAEDNNELKGELDRAAFENTTGEVAGTVKLLNFDTEGLYLNTELKMGALEEIYPNGRGGAVYALLKRGDEYETIKYDFGECLRWTVLFEMDGVGQYECRMSVNMWGTGELYDWFGDYMSEATRLAVSKWDENGMALEYRFKYGIYWFKIGTEANSFPNDVRVWEDLEPELSAGGIFMKEKLNLKSEEEKALEAANEKLGQAENTITSLEQERGNLWGEMGELYNELMEKDEKIEELGASVAEKDAKIVELEAEIEGKNAEIEQKNVRIAELKRSVEQKNMEIVGLETSIEEKKAEIVRLGADIEEKKAEIRMLKADIGGKEERIMALEADIERKIAEKAGLEAMVAELESTVVGLNATVAGLESAVVGLEAAVAELESTVAGLNVAKAELEEKTVELRAELLELRRAKLEIENELRTVTEKWQEAENDSQITIGKWQQAENGLQAMTEKWQQTDSNLQAMTKKWQRSEGDLQVMTEKWREANNKLQEVEEELKGVKSASEATKGEAQELKSEDESGNGEVEAPDLGGLQMWWGAIPLTALATALVTALGCWWAVPSIKMKKGNKR